MTDALTAAFQIEVRRSMLDAREEFGSGQASSIEPRASGFKAG
jgi:hypothetical protein